MYELESMVTPYGSGYRVVCSDHGEVKVPCELVLDLRKQFIQQQGRKAKMVRVWFARATCSICKRTEEHVIDVHHMTKQA